MATSLLFIRETFRAWWFDPLIATLSFWTWINLFWFYERKQGLSSDNTSWWGLSPSPIQLSVITYWIGLYVYRLIVSPPPNMMDGIPTNVEEALYLTTEVIGGIVLYDAIFFLLHWAMHDLSLLKSFHARHHTVAHQKVEARDVLRHGLVDGMLQVGVHILVQRSNLWNFQTKTRLARLIHNVLVTGMLTESHTSSAYPKIWRNAWFPGIQQHASHHNSAYTSKARRYQQFFGYLDDWREWYCFSGKKET